MGIRRQLCGAALVAAALVTPMASLAQAPEPERDLDRASTVIWTVTVTEYALLASTAGLAAMGTAGDRGGLILASALLYGVGAGYGSMQGHWDPAIAVGMHQGLWGAADLAALGALVGSASEREPGWRTAAWVAGLGLAGAGVGVASSLLVDTETEAAIVYLAPLASALAGGGTYLGLTLQHQLDGGEGGDVDLLPVWIAASAPLALGLVAVAGLSAVDAL